MKRSWALWGRLPGSFLKRCLGAVGASGPCRVATIGGVEFRVEFGGSRTSNPSLFPHKIVCFGGGTVEMKRGHHV